MNHLSTKKCSSESLSGSSVEIAVKTSHFLHNKVTMSNLEKCSSESNIFAFDKDTSQLRFAKQNVNKITGRSATLELELCKKLKRNSRSEESLLADRHEINFLHRHLGAAATREGPGDCRVDNESKLETGSTSGSGELVDDLNISDASKESLDKLPNQLKSVSDSLEKQFSNKMMPPLQSPASNIVTDSQGLIVPKKIMNPCRENNDRQNLHRELLFNQKIGKNVLNQKSELQKVLQKQKERNFISEQKMLQDQTKTKTINDELDRVIMERARRMENSQKPSSPTENDSHVNPEYLNARAKLRHTIDTN